MTEHAFFYTRAACLRSELHPSQKMVRKCLTYKDHTHRQEKCWATTPMLSLAQTSAPTLEIGFATVLIIAPVAAVCRPTAGRRELAESPG